MALTYTLTGPMIRDTYADHYDKSMDTYLKREDRIPEQGGRFFVPEDATTLSHKITTWSDVLNIPRQNEDTNKINMDQPAPGYDKELTILTYRNGIAITRTLADIDRSGKIGRMQGGLLSAGRRLYEFAYADVIINGTTTTGADGVALFADNHPHEDSAGGTWDNLETAAALTTTSFNTARANMRKRKNEKGYVSPIKAMEIIGPPDLEQKMRQISGSDKIPEDALNAINPWKGVKSTVWDHLTDTNGWGLWGDLNRDNWGLHVAILSQPNVMRLSYGDNPDIIRGWRYRTQFAVGASVVKNMSWNVGA